MRDARLLISASLTSILLACGAIGGDKYSGRDGKAEALNDLRIKRPLVIYSQVENGVAVEWASPGLVSCSPSEASGNAALHVFRTMSEAAFQEGETRTAAEQRVAASTLRFARDYNIAAFRHRRAEVKMVCPDVRLD